MSVTPDNQTVTVDGVHRDVARRYRLNEIDPLTMSGYMLRLVAALRIDSLDSITLQFAALSGAQDGEASDEAVNALFRVLAGCDPNALHALISDMLRYVEVARDPAHPGVYMLLDVKQDMKDIGTLRRVLSALIALNFKKG